MYNYLFVLHNGVHYINHYVWETNLELKSKLIDRVLDDVSELFGYSEIVNIIKLKDS